MQEVQTINDDLLGSNYCHKINLPPDISSVGFLSCAVDQRSGERLTLEMSALKSPDDSVSLSAWTGLGIF